jgi:hypothetical protein
LLALAAGLGFALWAAFQSGRTHPDEVYQFLEPANRLAFGFGFQTWEWQQGLRNWAVPGLLAAAMKGVDLLGFKSAFAHRLGASFAVALLSYPGLLALLGYARRRCSVAKPDELARVTEFAPRLALVLMLGWALSLYYLGRTMGEPLGALLGIAGLGALDEDRPGGWRAFRGGVYVGLAVVVRYAFAVLAVAVILQELGRRRWSSALFAALGGATVALALGGLDWATWGHPFHSMLEYLKFNVSSSGAAMKFGREPATYFLPVALQWLPWPLLLGLARFDWRRDQFLMPSLLYAIAVSVTAHKEERFFVPVVFWVTCALAPAAAVSAVTFWRRSNFAKGAVALGGVLFVGMSAWVYSTLPDLESDLFKATMQVGNDPAMTGLIIVNESRWGCGGNVYLGRPFDVKYTGPGYPGFFEAMGNRSINRAVIFRGQVHPELTEEVERYGFHKTGAIGPTDLLER